MKVLLVRGNPRKHGHTQRLTDLLLQGLNDTPAKVVDVDLTTLNPSPCLGCYHCWLVTPGQCVHGDGMDEVLVHLLDADVLVCVTPLYYFAMSSYLKIFFERTFPLAQPGLVPSGGGLTRNRLRHPERWRGKKMITLITGALHDLAAYRPANETFRLIADTLDLELGGQLTRPESYLLDYPLSKPKTLKRIEAAFVQAGREAGTAGRLSAETMTNAALPLAADAEHFRAYSNIYWTHANELGEQGLEPAVVARRVANEVRILMRELVRCHDPKATAGVKAVLQFEFPDQELVYHIRLHAGQCALAEGTVANPHLRVRCHSQTWAAIFTRQADVLEALRTRQLTLAGDKTLFKRLERFFPPPAG